ncbi:carboxypeptidase M32 [Aquabacterium sp. A7-Y]|uniref:carboxypeptidase M32 n=1 Tax=Aquabacterium sp. A7-Y TaxID=1349605 RepID=UPI00223E0399|nr:carboxypeptidase M32 [Aquabacterium sp. A7-Y]MCW7538063.1 carboxypeptidase M32 [Aquabacterium sp. A7-Y]
MPSPSTPAYNTLERLQQRLHRLRHLQSIAHWDQACNMPPKGSEARGAALAEIASLLHGLGTEPRLKDDMARAAQEPLDELQRANLREIERAWQRATALPDELVQARSLAASRCEHEWRRQRPANDWTGFLENFRPVLRLARQEAQLLSAQSGLSPYDTLLDTYEPGMRASSVEAWFADLKSWLPALIARVASAQAGQPVIAPQGPFPREAQRALSEEVMSLLGFDFEAGRLDESTHPFSGGVPEDVRLTTRYREDNFVQSLMATIHETGHARYEQNLPRAGLGQPVAQARSMAIHESQSLTFEMQLARSRPFAEQLSPLLMRHFGAQAAFEAGNLHRLLTRVSPGFIRVNADEVSYPAHVILRFEIERALIEGDAEAEDIPGLWDEKMAAYLGLDTRGNFRDGCMQDVHWAEGLFGYFPCYTLGAMYAAQWFATMRRQMPDLDDRIARGELQGVFDWLREHIWQQGSRWTTDELAQRASGEALNPAFFRAHLQGRYLAGPA